MDKDVTIIYVHGIEWTDFYAPCQAKHCEKDIYTILENDSWDLHDYTTIWEFFPGDIVKCKKKGNDLYAVERLGSIFPNRKFHELVFHIVASHGDSKKEQLLWYEQEIKMLHDGFLQKTQHPDIKKWVLNNS